MVFILSFFFPVKETRRKDDEKKREPNKADSKEERIMMKGTTKAKLYLSTNSIRFLWQRAKRTEQSVANSMKNSASLALWIVDNSLRITVLNI